MRSEPKPIVFGSLNTYKAANTINENESTIAKNLSIDKSLNEVKPLGPWSKLTYPASITSFYKWDGHLYVQCGVNLYKDGVGVYVIDNASMLYYHPFTNANGIGYLVFSNSGGNYKTDGTTYSKLGVDPMGIPPTPNADIVDPESELYRVYLSGYWSATFSSPYRSLLANKNVKVHTYPPEPYSGGTATYSPRYIEVDRYNDGNSTVELITEKNIWVTFPADSHLPLFYLTLDTLDISWANITKLYLSMSSNINFAVNELVVELITDAYNHTIFQPDKNIWTAQQGAAHNQVHFPGAFPRIHDYLPYNSEVGEELTTLPLNAVIRVPIAEMINNEEKLYAIDISSLTTEQKASIKTVVLSLNKASARASTKTGINVKQMLTLPDIQINLYSIYVSNSTGVGRIKGEAYSYIVTYKNAIGTESVASPPSPSVNLNDQKVKIPIEAADESVEKILIYRVGGVQTEYRLVVELTNETQVYIDDKIDSELGVKYSASLDKALPPPIGLKGLFEHLNRLFGYKDNILYYSEKNNFEAYGDGLSNKIEVGDSSAILGGVSLGNVAIAIKANNKIYVISQLSEGIFSPKSIIIQDSPVTDNALFPDQSGVTFLGKEGIYEFNTVQALEKAMEVKNKFVGAAGRLFKAGNRIVCTNPGLIINTVLNLITETAFGNTLTYADAVDNKIYLGFSNGDIYIEDAAGTLYPFNMEYQTKQFEYELPQLYKYGRVFMATVNIVSGTCTAKFYADDVLIYTKALSNGRNYFKLPPYYKGKRLCTKIEAVGNVTINSPALVIGNLPEEKYR